MTLSYRQLSYDIPSYSVSGDILAFEECGLRYRYQHRASLPPSRPVQFWAGQFMHGVLEEVLLASTGDVPPAPEIEAMARIVVRRLEARGVTFRNHQMLGFAMERVLVALETWGPGLFGMIGQPEVRLRALRPMPTGAAGRSDHYEITGVVDVLAGSSTRPNPAPATFDGLRLGAGTAGAIVDYKGDRRPTRSELAWDHHGFQVQTYAWLRSRQPDTASARVGLLLYLNELAPGPEEMQELRRELLAGPPSGDVRATDADQDVIVNWADTARRWKPVLRAWEDDVRAWVRSPRPRQTSFPRLPAPVRSLSSGYRQQRAERRVSVAVGEISRGLDRFDETVERIEHCVTQELTMGSINRVWPTNPEDQKCMRCDFRSHCPASPTRFRRPPVAP